jgi:tRNA C32,U32 (ribose-2'-O)-methylase TrmJ
MKSLAYHHGTNARQHGTLPSPVSNRHSHPRRRRRPFSAITPTATTERDEWVSSIRNTTGRLKHRLWAPHLSLDPPPVLYDIAVVLVSPKRPTSVGSVARALSCFECVDLRLVNPRCDHLSRPARNSSKGAQYLLWRATTHESLEDAIDGATATVAFTRWLNGLHGIPSYRSMKTLVESLNLQQKQPQSQQQGGGTEEEEEEKHSDEATTKNKLVLVFGREEEGLRPEEVTACTAACSIPIGRLQESLSLSHAVSLVLAPLFEARQEELMIGGGGGAGVDSREDLAVGVELQDD